MKQVTELQNLCRKNDYRLMSFSFSDTFVKVFAQKLDDKSKPVLEHVRDETDYQLLYKQWVDHWTRMIGIGETTEDAVKAAIKHFQ